MLTYLYYKQLFPFIFLSAENLIEYWRYCCN